jgi:hypothetical protein
VIVDPISADPVKVGVVTLVSRSELDDPLSLAAVNAGAAGAAGAVVSTVIVVSGLAGPALPAGSVARVVTVCAPLVSVLATIV